MIAVSHGLHVIGEVHSRCWYPRATSKAVLQLDAVVGMGQECLIWCEACWLMNVLLLHNRGNRKTFCDTAYFVEYYISSFTEGSCADNYMYMV